VGWVSAVDGYIWETRHAIRPREDLRAEAASEGLSVGDERVACMYETIEGAIAGEACQTPILGGYRWFNYPLRIPILDRVEQDDRSFFRVAMPTAGIGSDASGDVLQQFGGLDAAISDGGVLQAIQAGFANDFRFEGVQVRYGFRAYRDYYAGDAGMGEVFPLGTDCSPSKEDLEAQNAAFLNEIQTISAETGANDLAALKEQGQNFTPENASQMLTQGFSRDLDPVIPFFIQVPRTHDETTLGGAELEAYDRAYRRFETQGSFYVNAVSDHFQQDLNLNQNVRIAEHFYSLDGTSIGEAKGSLVEFIFDKVALFGDQRPLNELGDACENRVFNSVAEGYIEDNGDVIQDVLFSSEEFRTWRSKLDALKNSNQVTATELSEMIVKMMVDGLRNSTQEASGGTDQPGLVEICELYRVARWLESHRELFDTIEASEIPTFSLDPVQSCDMRYPTPELTLKERTRFPEETMSFRHVLSDNTVYWIPNAYLP